MIAGVYDEKSNVCYLSMYDDLFSEFLGGRNIAKFCVNTFDV